jgi:uncharacterized membrane protein YgcG
MKMLILIAVLLVVTILQGCQLDVQGPSMSAKLFYKGENNGDVYKSRGSGMSGGNSYASNGGTQMTSTGSGGSVVSWGTNK